MKAAIDSNVLFDLLESGRPEPNDSERTLADAIASGPVALCPVVYAELAAGFDLEETLLRFLGDFGIQTDHFSSAALWLAGQAWRRYTRQRGRLVQCARCERQFEVRCPACDAEVVWRQHLVADFLIGGHALAQADVLITRDPGYYRIYFPDLKLIVPAQGRA